MVWPVGKTGRLWIVQAICRFVRLRAKHAIFDDEIQTRATESGPPGRNAWALEKNPFFSSCLTINAANRPLGEKDRKGR